MTFPPRCRHSSLHQHVLKISGMNLASVCPCQKTARCIPCSCTERDVACECTRPLTLIERALAAIYLGALSNSLPGLGLCLAGDCFSTDRELNPNCSAIRRGKMRSDSDWSCNMILQAISFIVWRCAAQEAVITFFRIQQ